MVELASLNLYKRLNLKDLIITMDDELRNDQIYDFVVELTSKRDSQMLNKKILDYYSSKFDQLKYEHELDMDRR